MRLKWYDAIWTFALCVVVCVVLASFVSDNPPALGGFTGAALWIVWQYWNFAHCKPSVFHGIE